MRNTGILFSTIGLLTFAITLLGACGDDDEGSGPGGTGNNNNNVPNTDGGPFPVIDPASEAKGTCPYDKSTAGGTATHGFTIPANHPRLWWTPERIERAKGWLASHPVSPKSDDYTNIAFLHAVTGSDCSGAIKWATELELDDNSFNVASNELRWFGEQVILTYDWCFDQLTAGQKTTLTARWSDYFSRAVKLSWGGPSMPSSNYFWGYLRNEIMWGIAANGEDPTAATLLNYGLVDRWQNAFLPFGAGTGNGDGRGGVPQEGTQYGQYHVNYPVNPFGTTHLLGRSLYDESEFFKGSVFYLLYSTMQGKTVTEGNTELGFDLFPFNDDEGWHNHNTAIANEEFMAHASQTWHCLPVGKYARGWMKLVNAEPAEYISAVDKGGESLDAAGLPLDYYAPGPRFYFGRSAWGVAATAFHWQLGDYITSGVGHSHEDYGNFQMWRGGRWLTREATGYSDTYTGYDGTGEVGSSSTLAHNALLVNGKGVANGELDGPSIVRRLESQPEYAYVNVDMTKAYRNTNEPNHPERDNPAAAHVEREMVFVRSLETMVILDRVESATVDAVSAAAVKKTFLAHFETNPVMADATHVTATNGPQALGLTVLVPSNPQTKIVDEKSADNNKNGLYRVEVNVSGAAQSFILTVLHGRDAAAPALTPTVAEDADKFTVTLNATTTLVFQKGNTSAGGSVTIGGATKNLRPDVQGVKLTDAGPAWL